MMNWLLIAFRTDSWLWFMSLLIQRHLNGKEKLLVFHSIASHPLRILVGLWVCFSTRICTTFISGCEHRSIGALGDGKIPLSILKSFLDPEEKNSNWLEGIWGGKSNWKYFLFTWKQKWCFWKQERVFCLAESFTERSFNLLLCKLVPFHSIKENKKRSILLECRSLRALAPNSAL